MRTFEIEYVSYEGKVRRHQIELDDDAATIDDAKDAALKEDHGYGDGIHEIIDCHEL